MLESLILYAISAVITLSVQRSISGSVTHNPRGFAEEAMLVLLVMAIHPIFWVAWAAYWVRWIAEG